MLNLNEVKNRIKTVGETSQITNAMKLISVAKMRRAMIRYNNNHTYADKVRQTIKDILIHSEGVAHPYLEQRPVNRAVYVVIAAEKGLVGGYNNNVLNLAYEDMQGKEKYVFTIGRLAAEFFAKRGVNVDMEYLHIVQNPSIHDARMIAMDIIELYDSNHMDEVIVAYTELNSNTEQTPKLVKLLPLDLDTLLDVQANTNYGQITYDPSPQAVLDLLVPQYIVGMIYGMLVQSVASEHSARMITMENATRNAGEMLDSLKLIYQRARQEAITNELNEIVAPKINDSK